MQTTKERLLLFRQRLRQILSVADIYSNPDVGDGWIIDQIESSVSEGWLVGTITCVREGGLAYIKSFGERDFYFTFGKVSGYKGQTAKELKQFSPRGLAVGVKVQFTLDSEGHVQRVMPFQQ